jgi:aminoglycoside 6-adenylyltransferase
MRSEKEMLDLILQTAREDPRIRAVIINGSRVNPNAPADIFQDYDIIYVVTEVEPYVHNMEWIARFGERIIMQMPEEIDDPPPSNDGCFVYLMQFADGNRIDLTIYPLEKLDQLEEDSLSLSLLDKDGILPAFEPPSDRTYLPKPPTAKQFADCCNEFWWVAAYVAKGLWREEITFAKHMLDVYVRDELVKMINWTVAARTQSTQSPGKFLKYARKFLEPHLWDLLMSTYSNAGIEQTWDALENMCELFHILAVEVADHFGFDYLLDEETRVRDYLRHVRRLPKDASNIY